MTKRLVVLCDGTWNTPESETNIHWLNQFARRDSDQIVYYDVGVGTDWYSDKIGGNFGVGLSRNVRQAYRFVLEHYQPGDELYVLGFSRGAFTARSLCGFMNLVGRLDSEDAIARAFVYYRLHEPGEDDNIFERFIRPTSQGPISVRFVGVFDTVGALGLPFEIEDRNEDLKRSFLESLRDGFVAWVDGLGDRLRRPIKGFHDTSLSPNVEEAYHALAIDERRALFAPTLWTRAPGQAVKIGAQDLSQVRQTVEQVWFAGSHVDIGGGDTETKREDRLSNLALLWIVEKAGAAGMTFEPGFVQDLQEWRTKLPGAAQHLSMNDHWRKLHRLTGQDELIRPIGNQARKALDPKGSTHPPVHTAETLHQSVRERLGREVVMISSDEGPQSRVYQPPNIAGFLSV
ncbi:MAG: DUF2235 domain-containing protein [Geminicoccaceae bacterium]